MRSDDLEKKTVLRSIDVSRDGTLIIKLALVVTEMGAVLGSRTHGFSIRPGDDVENMLGHLNADLAALSLPTPDLLQDAGLQAGPATVTYPALSSDDIDKVKAAASAAWTPEVLAAENSRRESARRDYEEQEARQAKTISRVQFMALASQEMGNLEPFLEVALATIDPPTARAMARARFQNAQTFERDDPLISSLAAKAGLSRSRLDELWAEVRSL